MIKEIDHQVFYIVFQAVRGYSLGISLHARVVGVAASSEELAGSRVLRELVLLSDLAGLSIVKIFIAVKAET